MLWSRGKTLKVELLTPISLSAPPTSPRIDTSEQAANKDAKTNTDLAFKLITFGALASQAALLIYGYSLLVGYYEQFGIDTNELALGTPTLLLHGYINLFSSALNAADRWPIVGPGLLALIFVGVAAIFVSVISRRPTANVVIGLAMWIGISMFMAFFAPAVGVQQGVGKGLSDFKKFTQVNAPDGLENIHTVVTDNKERLSGHLILADSKSTFLLVGMKVFKLDGSTGHVIRETELNLKQPPPPKLPAHQ